MLAAIIFLSQWFVIVSWTFLRGVLYGKIAVLGFYQDPDKHC